MSEKGVICTNPNTGQRELFLPNGIQEGYGAPDFGLWTGQDSHQTLSDNTLVEAARAAAANK